MARMNETDLLRVLEEEAREAFHYQDTDVAADRVRAVKAYMREPYGNEEEGRSSVVASDVFDAVEGVLPDLIEVFTASDKAVVFEPVGPEDVESAEQVTNACNYVFYKQNNGFFILYTAIKDGLMMKTGGIKWYWEKKRTPIFTTYRNVDEMQLAVFLTSNPKAEVVEQEEVEADESQVVDAEAAGFIAPRRFTVKIKAIEEKGRVAVCAIPPEELHVSRRHNSLLLDDCQYVAHVAEKSLSDIRQMGFKVSVDDVKAARNDGNTAEDDIRDTYRGRRVDYGDEFSDLDESMVRGWLREEYVLVDFDGDGIAERRRIIRLGDLILENKECSHVPISAWTPYLLTHRFDGLSLADLVEEFQRINTEIVRAQLDNLSLANTQETVVQTDSQGNPLANIDDLLNRRPGGIIREKVAGAVRPYQERWQGIEAMPMVELLNQAKENRTGWTRYSQGLDANSLNKTATGVQMIMNASQKRMKLMARIVAEALVAPMFKGIYKTLMDYGMEAMSYRLNGKFVKIDPQDWRDQYDMTINVGIGTGDVQQQSQFMLQIAQAQAMAMQGGLGGVLVTPKNLYNLQARLAENAGFKNPAEFWTDPDTAQPQQPKPDPKAMAEQAKLQNDQQKTQAQMQLDVQKTQAQMSWEREKTAMQLQFDAEQKERDRQHQMQMEMLKRDLALPEPESDEPDEKEQLMAAQMQQVMQTVMQLAQVMAAPKQVIRDEAGRAIGVQPLIDQAPQDMQGIAQALQSPKQVVRDDQGRAVGMN